MRVAVISEKVGGIYIFENEKKSNRKLISKETKIVLEKKNPRLLHCL